MDKNRKTAVVVDYGLGNLFSIQRALIRIGAEAVISSEPSVVESAEHLILPGVGSFGEGMDNLAEKGLIEPVRSYASSGRPLLGICLGMQLLMSESEEGGVRKGLDIVKGKVVRFPEPAAGGPVYKVPNIGWNGIFLPEGLSAWEGTILEGVKENEFMYFVHSYVVMPENPENILSLTNYGALTYCSTSIYNNIYGCQYHPEKSGETGLEILKNFLGI
jgi:glutamine amidotransferase